MSQAEGMARAVNGVGSALMSTGNGIMSARVSSPNKIAGIFLLASLAVKVLRRCWVAGIALSRLSIGLKKAHEWI
jgi:hypothetical protein